MKAQHTPTEFHLIFFGPSKTEYVEWPAGSVSVYAIGGDEIADRIGRDAQGKIVRRDGWCGYLGCFRSLDEAMAAIAKARGEVARRNRLRQRRQRRIFLGGEL